MSTAIEQTVKGRQGGNVRAQAENSRPGEQLAPPPKLRRRPALVAVSVAAITLGALLSVWAYTSTSNTVEVVAVRETVQRGDVIDREDLLVARIGTDPVLRPVSAARIDELVGMYAAMDMAAGGVVTEESLTDSVAPSSGRSVVGVSLTPAMMPADQLRVGDAVRIVSTPGLQGTVEQGEPPTIRATVVGVRALEDGTGSSVVNVQVADSDAGELAARASTGNVALILDSLEEQ